MEELKGKKKKEILKALEEYGIEIKGKKAYLANNSLYILTPEAFELLKYVDKRGIKCRGGFYLAKFERNGLRLSFDACQLFAKQIKKYIEIDDEKAERWFKGEEIEINAKDGFFVLKNNEDLIGCGLVKEGKIKNYVPKDRRIKP
jgi:NOL1/NOP2/fmu family ribosome biogenesis protein